ncbi:MAG: amylosucrase [Burkholderiales bacterium]|nr:amylosucrase [Burkholderiales bacterium]
MLAQLPAGQRDLLAPRFFQHAPVLLERLRRLYGDSEHFAGWCQQLMQEVISLAGERPAALRAQDQSRSANKNWFGSQDMLGYCTYVDRFGGNLQGVMQKISHLQEMGVRYLHLLPFLRARDGENDGGFAVASYDEIEPKFGTMADLQALTEQLRAAEISLCSDFILNHVADDHPWACAAKAGDAAYQNYFHSFADYTQPARYEATLGQIFPQAAPGNFTFDTTLQRWIWTTFYPYQWDLNYSNPAVFAEMALALLRLANRGIEVFRLDSTAFLWKREGTNCMNQPEAHWILQAIRSIVEIAAPGVLLKAEAIVPTAQLPAYLGTPANAASAQINECHLAYHSSLMAAGWAALAEQNTDAIARVIQGTPALPDQASWLTYVRCHDDIGWNVLRAEMRGAENSDAIAQQRLAHVAQFYSGAGDSYARGASFQAADPSAVHGSVGMASALCGMSSASDQEEQLLARRRLLLLYGLALSFGGLPVIYMGDELAQKNEESYLHDPQKANDSRWLQRPDFDMAAFASRHDETTESGKIFSALLHLIRCRKDTAALSASAARNLIVTEAPQLLVFGRGHADDEGCVYFIGNFSGVAIDFALDVLHDKAAINGFTDLISGRVYSVATRCLKVEPYEQIWLRALTDRSAA